MAATPTYHHGDLRRAVISAALQVIRSDGVAAISLRDLARRAEVSHAAPAHHFKDKAGLLTAIAAEGFDLLADALTSVPTDTARRLREMGARYVEFAVGHPAHFEVMFRPQLLHGDDPELIAAKERSSRALRSGIEELPVAKRPTRDAPAWRHGHSPTASPPSSSAAASRPWTTTPPRPSAPSSPTTPPRNFPRRTRS